MDRALVTSLPVIATLVRCVAILLCFSIGLVNRCTSEELLAGTAKVEITDLRNGPPNDPLFVKALVLKQGATTVVLLSLDVVALENIGPIPGGYLADVRRVLGARYQIEGSGVIANASHCHGVVAPDVVAKTVEAVEVALSRLEPVRVGVGVGHEDKVQENRRFRLENGREADERHAYSLPADRAIVGVGEIDPEIGIVRFDRRDGTTLAILYNFACHPIQGVPSKGNTADYVGFASRVIEDSFGPDTLALFFQGCGGDINPIRYKDVDAPRDADVLGNALGISAMRGAKKIEKLSAEPPVQLINETLELPRADLGPKIIEKEAELDRLVNELRGTSLNLKTFLPLVVKQKLTEPFPAFYSHLYLHEKKLGRDGLEKLDEENRANVEAYVRNILIMEEITRLQENLRLMKMHQQQNIDSGSRTVRVELVGLRIGDARFLTFPGELTCQIGLNFKAKSPFEQTFVAGYTNGYIYYAPTASQLTNVGNAQEDSDCILAPEWEAIFETKGLEILNRLK